MLTCRGDGLEAFRGTWEEAMRSTRGGGKFCRLYTSRDVATRRRVFGSGLLSFVLLLLLLCETRPSSMNRKDVQVRRISRSMTAEISDDDVFGWIILVSGCTK
ncbi:hypothetical protein NL676_007569 [Syzygium grande]|nr:hypothetical protein NL676_007569 [Syzygium grande]